MQHTCNDLNLVTVPLDNKELSSSDLHFAISPFDQMLTKNTRIKCNSPTFGICLQTNEINNCAFIQNLSPCSSVSELVNFK